MAACAPIKMLRALMLMSDPTACINFCNWLQYAAGGIADKNIDPADEQSSSSSTNRLTSSSLAMFALITTVFTPKAAASAAVRSASSRRRTKLIATLQPLAARARAIPRPNAPSAPRNYSSLAL